MTGPFHGRTTSTEVRGMSTAIVSAPALESAARAALESRGRTLADPEWARARTKLLDFVTILREWDRTVKNAQPGLGNVEALCRREN